MYQNVIEFRGLERVDRKRLVSLKALYRNSLGRTKDNQKTVSLDSQCPSRDSKMTPSEDKLEDTPTQ
jgi:hypothetical protein